VKQDIDGYTKLSELGRGAYSTIFLARDRSNGEIRAIKQVEIKNAEQARFVGHLEQEHTIAQKFDHPVLRKTYKLIYSRKFIKVSGASLVMEYADGKPLAEMMPTKDYIGILKILRHLALGLDAMHWKRYVHADLKPENVIVNTEGRVKLIDYGQSFQMGEAKERVQGTVDFIAPEQVRREALDARTDVFGLGAVMYRVFTGHALRTMLNKNLNEYTMNLVGKRVDHKADPLADAALPPMLEKLILQCCQPRREDRPANMRAVKDLIELTMVKIHKQHIHKQQGGKDDDESGDQPAQAAG
jgi:serine/threonine-protein kinase